jgi:hypothetical protein
MFYGTATSYQANYWDNEKRLFGDVSISSNQPPGYYDLEVWDYNTNSWIKEENAFEVVAISNIFTPNSADLGETLQVFISGNSPSEFTNLSSSNELRLSKSYYNSYESFEVPNNSNNWVYNSSVGSYGFYSTITIPGIFDFTGNYDLLISSNYGSESHN